MNRRRVRVMARGREGPLGQLTATPQARTYRNDCSSTGPHVTGSGQVHRSRDASDWGATAG